MPSPIQRIVIVGANAAGWTTALELLSWGLSFDVRVIDCGTVQEDYLESGESGLPSMRAAHERLRLDSSRWLHQVKPTFKLGSQFQDWSQPGASYFLPFGQNGARFDGIAFHQHWLRTRNEFDSLTAFSLAAMAAKFNKFALPDADSRSIYSTVDFAFHFDASAYVSYLRTHAEQRGIRIAQGTFTDAQVDAEDGFITSVRLDTGEIIEADLFIDCSGQRGLLIEQALCTGFDDWSRWLPCDRVAIVQSAPQGELIPYTRATADNAGWMWRIPLQDRISNGHVYCDRFVSDDEAIATLLKRLGSTGLGAPRVLRFSTGRRKKFWNKNCVAIGLAAGCVEPLAFAQLHLLHRSLDQLHALFPEKDAMRLDSDEYNRSVGELYERARDFAIASFHFTQLCTEFWLECARTPIPDRLQHKLDVFQAQGRVVQYDNETFSESDWAHMLIGLEQFPKRCELLAETLDAPKLREQLRSMKTAISSAAQNMPSHRVLLDRYLEAQTQR